MRSFRGHFFFILGFLLVLSGDIVQRFLKTSKREFSGGFTLDDYFLPNGSTHGPRIFCLILTTSPFFVQGLHAKRTWARRCHSYAFLTNQDRNFASNIDYDLAMSVKISPVSRNWLTIFKELNAFIKVFDYMIITDDFSYVIMDGLELLLTNYTTSTFLLQNPFERHRLYGQPFSPQLLTRAALNDILTSASSHENGCLMVGPYTPIDYLTVCATRLGLPIHHPLDNCSRSLFQAHSLMDLFNVNERRRNPWKSTILDTSNPLRMPSRQTVSFGGVSATYMYILEYLLYHLRPVDNEIPLHPVHV